MKNTVHTILTSFQTNKIRSRFVLLFVFMAFGFVVNGQNQILTYTANGSFIVPAGVSTVSLEAWGGGGGGGFQGIDGFGLKPGGGGGGGGHRTFVYTGLTAGQIFTIVVGAGGAGATGSNDDGLNGATTIVTTAGFTNLLASPGLGGESGSLGDGAGGAGGSTGSGPGTGTAGDNGSSGGVPVGSGGNGGNGATVSGGAGGAGAANNSGNLATNGAVPGGGGGGRNNDAISSTGDGASGQVIITWVGPPSCTTPAINTNPSAASYYLHEPAAAMTVVSTGSPTLSFQWYSNTTNSNTIAGATTVGTNSSSYTPVTTTAGTLYYFCSITTSCDNTFNTSNQAAITVDPLTSARFTSNGSFILPTGVTNVTVEAWGGGGGGGYQGLDGLGFKPGGGGGGSGYRTFEYTGLAASQTFNIIVGAGGAGATSSNVDNDDGANGATTTVTTAGFADLLASPGLGGKSGRLGNGAGGAGGSTGSGPGTGTAGNNGLSGGTPAGSGGNGGNGATAAGGTGGAGAANGSGNFATNGAIPGGGGGGRNNDGVSSTGDGGSGQVLITWLGPPFCAAPTITTSPSGASYFLNETALAMTVVSAGSPTLSYQWYSNTTNTNTYGAATTIIGATSSTYTPITTTAGTLYYFCRITTSCNNLFNTSSQAAVIVDVLTSARFTSNGSFNVPAGVSAVTVKAWGGGGGGGFQGIKRFSLKPGGGGGGGGYRTFDYTGLTSSHIFNIVVGAGGAGGTSTNDDDGHDGATTTVSISDFTNLLASPGLGGKSGRGGNGAGGAGGTTGSGPGVGIAGNSGTATVSPDGAGGNGGNGATAAGGAGGAGAANGNGNYATNGTAPGGGGGGRNNDNPSSAGNGARGEVLLTWLAVICTTPTITTNPSGATYCLNETSAAMTAAGTGNPTLSYQWYSNTTNTNDYNAATMIIGASSSSYTPLTTSTGTLYYFCRITTSCDGSFNTTSTASIIVNPLPTSTFTAEETAVCENSTSNVYTTEAGQSNYDWTVSSGGTITAGGTSTDNSATITWGTAGAETVEVNYEDANACSAATAALSNVTVNPAANSATVVANPSDGLCAGDDVVFDFSGTANDLIHYTLNTVSATITLVAGAATLTITDPGVSVQTIVLTQSINNGGTCSLSLSGGATISVGAICYCTSGDNTFIGTDGNWDDNDNWSLACVPASTLVNPYIGNITIAQNYNTSSLNAFYLIGDLIVNADPIFTIDNNAFAITGAIINNGIIVNNNTLSASAGCTNNGLYGGNGTFTGNFTNNGTLKPAAP